MLHLPRVIQPSGNDSTDELRKSLLELIDVYLQRYPEEQFTVSQFADFVVREPACFERSTVEGHITAAVWLVDLTGETVLLTHHRKLNKWLQLGGHADGNGDIHAVALDEAREESGIREVTLLSHEIFDLDIHPIPARGADAAHLHYDVRFTAVAGSTNHVVSAESHDLAWVHTEQIGTLTTESSMLRMAHKWLLHRRS